MATMSHPRVAQSLENKLRKQASLIANLARSQFQDASLYSPSIRATFDGDTPAQQRRNFEQTKPNAKESSDSEVLEVSKMLNLSVDFLNEMSPANAFSDTEDISGIFYSVDPKLGDKIERSTVTSTPLNVVELSQSRSRMMSPTSRTKMHRANGVHREGLLLDSGSSSEQQLPGERGVVRLADTSLQLKRTTPNVERGNPSNISSDVDISATSVDYPSFDKQNSPKCKESTSELLEMIFDPEKLEHQWKCIDQNGAFAVDLNQILSWFSGRFPRMYDNGVAVCKAFNLVASEIGGDSKQLIPRRVFKRLLTAIIYIHRSMNCFSVLAPGSIGNPRINFEMFCSVISKMGSNMDRKRCLFEYQSIRSRTKDHLHVDDFNLWLINSKLMKITLEKYRPSSSINRTSKLMVGNEKNQSAGLQKQALQGFNMVNSLQGFNMETPELSFGNHLSTKKYSIGSVPFKNRIDRLNHDKGPDFFRSSLETQRKLKDERLSNVAKVAYEQRMRSLPPEQSGSSIPSNIKTDFASSRFASGIARPSFAKMYEFIDSSLESKLAKMVNEAVSTRMQAGEKILLSDNEQQLAPKNPTEEKTSQRTTLFRPFVSMSPAPQPSPRMHSRPLEYPSPAPQFSDISSFGDSPDYSSPSTFANIGLGWQDSMGLPINECGGDSPITKALKQITYHLDPLNASSPNRLFQGIAAGEEFQPQPIDEYSQMIEATFATLSPPGISPRGRQYSVNSQTTRIQSSNTSNPFSRTLSYRQLHVEDLYPESTASVHNASDESLEKFSVPSAIQSRTLLLDPYCAVAAAIPDLADSFNLKESSDPSHMLADHKTTGATTAKFNLFETIQEPDDDTVVIKLLTPQDPYTHLHTFPHRQDERNTAKYDVTKVIDKALDASLTGHNQSSKPMDLKDDVAPQAPTPLSQMNAYQDGSASEMDTATFLPHLGKLSPVECTTVLPTATAGEISRHISKKSDETDSISNIGSARIAIKKQEVIALEEGIDSIRGIAELLEMYTSIPSAVKKFSPNKEAASQTSSLADSNINDVLPREIRSERPSSQVAGCDHSPSEFEQKQKQQQGFASTSADKLQPLLPDISSPEQPYQKANIVANILRDALPVKGLDLSQNESDVDEAAISGDDSGGEGGSGNEDEFDVVLFEA